LIKTADKSTVYFVFPAGVLHPIFNEAAAAEYFGSNWASYITIVSAAEIAGYKMGNVFTLISGGSITGSSTPPSAPTTPSPSPSTPPPTAPDSIPPSSTPPSNATPFVSSPAAAAGTAGLTAFDGLNAQGEANGPQIYHNCSEVTVQAPGKMYKIDPALTNPQLTLAQVPWESLGPGDVVCIPYRTQPYRYKFKMTTQGSASNPIRVLGMHGPNGERPILSGDNAVSSPSNTYSFLPNQKLGVIILLAHYETNAQGYSSPVVPAYIVIAGLKIQNAKNAFSFTGIEGGAPQKFFGAASAIAIIHGDNILIEDNEITDAGNGIFSKYESAPTQYITLRGNYIHHNGNPGSYFEHNVYLEAKGCNIIGNTFGPLVSGSLGANYTSRCGQDHIIGNYFSGSQAIMDLADPQSGAPYILPETNGNTDPTIVAGNYIVNFGGPDGAMRTIKFGGTTGSGFYQNYRKKMLFYNNTVIMDTYKTPVDGGNQYYTYLFFMNHVPDDVDPNDAEIWMENNIIVNAVPKAGATQSDLYLAGKEGKLHLGKNWISPGTYIRQLNPGQTQIAPNKGGTDGVGIMVSTKNTSNVVINDPLFAGSPSISPTNNVFPLALYQHPFDLQSQSPASGAALPQTTQVKVYQYSGSTTYPWYRPVCEFPSGHARDIGAASNGCSASSTPAPGVPSTPPTPPATSTPPAAPQSPSTPATLSTYPTYPATFKIASTPSYEVAGYPPVPVDKVYNLPAQPVTSHPRLWVRQSDLPRLRSWAADPNNLIYQQGFKQALQQAVTIYDTEFFPNNQPNQNFPDTGGIGVEERPVETFAQFFAFASLIDPNVSARTQHAQRAKRLLMYAIDEASKGVVTSTSGVPVPYRHFLFGTYDRANYWGQAWGLAYDWLQNDPSLFSPQEKKRIRDTFVIWSRLDLTAYSYPTPVGAINSTQLLGSRVTANNYFLGHTRNMTLMALAIDPADDAPIDPSRPAGQLGNTLRSFIPNITGAWMYQISAMFEDPAKSSAALGVSPTTQYLGDGWGGLPVEGSLYGKSLGFVQEAMLAMYTAGYTDPATLGSGMTFMNSTYWDKYIQGFLHTIAPIPKAGPSYMGEVYLKMGYGDMLRTWATPYDDFTQFGILGVKAMMTGDTKRAQDMRWIATNVVEGGEPKLITRAGGFAGGNIWPNGLVTEAILYFMLFDPQAPTPQDPRPSLPTNFVMNPNSSFGRILSRTDWTPNSSWFGYRCSWETINHQNGDCMQFDFYRKGEFLTKERSGYANDMILMTSDYHNTLAIENDKPGNIQFFETETVARGGQWTNGRSAGDAKTMASVTQDYAFAYSDATNLYNHPNAWSAADAAMDVTHASRSILWLKPDVMVTYDRATTKTANRFKRFNLNIATPAQVSGKSATVTTSKGQKFYIDTLLPTTATMKASQAENFNLVAQMEPMQFRIVVEDQSKPADVRFLHVMQATDGGAKLPTQTIQAQGATPYAGAVVGSYATLFPVNGNATFASVSYSVPNSVTKHFVTGLTPNASYTVSKATSGSSIQVSIVAGSGVAADAAGVIEF